MGFCYGGGKAIRYTTEVRPSAATVIYYGSPVSDVAALSKLKAPVGLQPNKTVGRAQRDARGHRVPAECGPRDATCAGVRRVRHAGRAVPAVGRGRLQDGARGGGRRARGGFLLWCRPRLRGPCTLAQRAASPAKALAIFTCPARSWSDVEQIQNEQMPQVAAYRLTTNFLRNFFEDKPSFSEQRAFLEFQLAQQAASAEESDGKEWDEDEVE
eukprot:6929484-Prymnesium_polylepis.1